MSGWPHVRLGDCCEIVSGATPSTSEGAYWDGDICWATPKDLSELRGPYISDTPRKLTKAGLDSCAAAVLPPGSVLFSSRAPIGHVAVNTVPMATNQGFKSFVPDPNRVHAKFLYHWLRKNRPYLEALGHGATFKEVSKAVVSRIDIALPPLPEQRRIADVLDRAEALGAKRRAALVQLDTLTQFLFLGLFGDPEGKSGRFPTGVLDDLCSFFSGFAWKAERFSMEPVGLPIVRIQNVDAVKDAECVYWPDAYDERFVIRSGDLLLTLSGSFRIAEWTGPDALLNQRIVRIESKPGIERLWLLHAIRLVVTRIEALGRHALVNNVALSDLKQLPLVRPPIDLQHEFVRRLGVVEMLKAAQRASLAELDAFFLSLQHRGFRGEL